ncbi:MAG: putative membrane protein YfcA [Pseudomonadales bacterium]|jgi:uncharacterized membrane protein YfcA
MDIVTISLVALVASTLTLFSGFGLGTLLMPVVAIFFPLDIAIMITAIVHLANNLFKAALLGKDANLGVLLRFGGPAIIAALVGATLLSQLSIGTPIFQYSAFSNNFSIVPVKLVIGTLILVFVFLELSPLLAELKLDKKYLPLGGIISGFFGGLSGHQGALRSMFLIKAGLSKEQFIATGVMLAIMVDVSRMTIYGWDIVQTNTAIAWPPVICATVAAFTGAYFGKKLITKVTIRSIQILVSILLSLAAAGLILGII